MATKPEIMAFLTLGYQKYALPIKAAQLIQAAMLENPCVAVENMYMSGCGYEVFFPSELDVRVEPIKVNMVVCADEALLRHENKDAYKAYIQAKVSLIGTEYRPETYQQYLANKDITS